MDGKRRQGRPARPLLRAPNVGARILLGLVFFVCGLNGFLNFIPPPSTPMPEQAMAFIGALVATGYMLPLVAGTQVVGREETDAGRASAARRTSKLEA